MFPYKATQYDTFMALVQASNPGLDIAPLTSDQLRALVPTAVTADAFGRDTSVRLMVRPGNSKYYGSQTVTYRRINLANYFRNMKLTLDDYTSGTTNLTSAQFASSFNAKYGMALVTTDYANASFASGTLTTVTISGTSLCYSGSFQVTWTRGKQYISSLITNPVIAGRLYPGGNTMPPTLPVGDFFTYNLDCTSVKAQLSTMSGVWTPANLSNPSSAGATVLAFLQRARPDLNLSSADSATPGGLGNLTWTRYTLPSASVPGANSSKYASLTIVKAVAGSWFQGQLYLHYN